MSLRDWFAGKALAGALAHPTAFVSDFDTLAGASYKMADAMIRARARNKGAQ